MSQREILFRSKKDELKNSIVISINCPNNKTNINVEKVIDLLTLHFHDIDEEIEGYKTIKTEDCMKIKAFIEKHSSIKRIVIHCTAGVSRSAGIGCALALYLNKDDFYIRETEKYLPNNMCFYLMLETLGIFLSEDEKNKRKFLTENQMEKSYKEYLEKGLFSF